MNNNNSKSNIIEHREFNINKEEDKYNLRIEIDQQYIYFILSKLNESLDYNYKNKMDLKTIVNKLELNSSKYSTLELVLAFFDIIYEKNKIEINFKDDNSCNLTIKLINIFEEKIINEIILYKEYMNNNDKFNFLYNKIKVLNNSTHSPGNNIDFKNKLNELNKKEEKIQDILNQKDNILKEMKEKLINHESEIQNINKNIIEIINKKLEEIENKLNNTMNEKFNAIKKKLKENINKQNQQNSNNTNNHNISNNMNNKIKESEEEHNNTYNMNNKIKELEEKYNKLIQNIEKNKEKEQSIGMKIQEDKNDNELLNNNNEELNKIIKENELIKEEINQINNKIEGYDKKMNLLNIGNIIKQRELALNNLKENNADNQKILIKNLKLDETKKKEKGLNLIDSNNSILKNENNTNNQLLKNSINNKLEPKIDNNIIEELNENINNKYNELMKKINHFEYINKINYNFINEPTNLKYISDITDTNTNIGWNDMFEVFLSYKDNKEYLISPNNNNYNLDLFELIDNKKILSLRGHKNDIRTVRYFFNKNNCNEYLISADDNKLVILWDVTDNYNIKHKIETKYENNIYSCLLIFPHYELKDYIITSTYHDSDNIEISASKIYSLNSGRYINYLINSNYNPIYYLLSWYNKKNNKYYIIQFSYLKILLNDFFSNEYYELIQEPETDHFSGFIYTKNNIDYLCSSSENGYINNWDLYNKNIFKIINTNNSFLAHIIQWNDKYTLVADFNNKSFKIVDLEEDQIISLINSHHTKEVKSIKKINHPIYGESLLSCSKDNTIKLWSI